MAPEAVPAALRSPQRCYETVAYPFVLLHSKNRIGGARHPLTLAQACCCALIECARLRAGARHAAICAAPTCLWRVFGAWWAGCSVAPAPRSLTAHTLTIRPEQARRSCEAAGAQEPPSRPPSPRNSPARPRRRLGGPAACPRGLRAPGAGGRGLLRLEAAPTHISARSSSGPAPHLEGTAPAGPHRCPGAVVGAPPGPDGRAAPAEGAPRRRAGQEGEQPGLRAADLHARQRHPAAATEEDEPRRGGGGCRARPAGVLPAGHARTRGAYPRRPSGTHGAAAAQTSLAGAVSEAALWAAPLRFFAQTAAKGYSQEASDTALEPS